MADKKITDLPAGGIGRSGDLLELVQNTLTTTVSNKAPIESLPFNGPSIPPTTPSAVNDEFTSAATLPGGGGAIWTWDNQGGATIGIGIGNKGAVMSGPSGASNTNMRFIYQAAPTAPWKLRARVAYNNLEVDFLEVGIGLWESATNKRIMWGLEYNTTPKLSLGRWTSGTGFSAVPFTTPWPHRMAYIQIENTGVNLIYSGSVDGLYYFPFYTEALTASFTTAPNRVGLALNAYATAVNASFHWFRSV